MPAYKRAGTRGVKKMSRSGSQEVRDRAVGAVLRNAIFSWQTGVTLALTAILFLFVQQPFPWWQDWFWLVGGAIAEAAFIAANLSDPEAASKAISGEFEAKFNLSEIRSPLSRQRLQSALEYRRNMMRLAERHQGAMRASLKQTVADITDWIGHMHDLALHI